MTGSYSLDALDPALRGSALSRQILAATCPGLVRNEGFGAGAVVPDVAAAMPTVSDDGRTYTFAIRPGFDFAPPSDEAVTAETFRSTLERTVSPNLADDAAGVGLLRDVQGASTSTAPVTLIRCLASRSTVTS